MEVSSWENPLQIAIFHGYVKLPEGTYGKWSIYKGFLMICLLKIVTFDS